MSAVVTCGVFFGDEGKGKVNDYLSGEASVAIRYNGGNNAGHSVVIGGKRRAVHILPAAAFRPGMKLIVAAGCVFDPAVMVAEILSVRDVIGVWPDLLISEKCHLISKSHRDRDAARELELQASGAEVGTTRRGNGPCYADKMIRSGIRLGDIYDLNEEELKLEYNLSPEGVKLLSRFMGDDVTAIYNYYNEGYFLLYCGAHGSLLDVDHGTYPFVTSSNCVAGAACTGGGLPPTHVGTVVGIAKSYITRIGTGPFISEIEDKQLASQIRETGKEYGTTTGRPRRIGWMDLEALQYSNMLNGFTYIALTMLDVLTGIPGISIRMTDGTWRDHAGWEEDISEITKFDRLPILAQNYVRLIEDEIGVPIKLISVGPDRRQIIDRR